MNDFRMIVGLLFIFIGGFMITFKIDLGVPALFGGIGLVFVGYCEKNIGKAKSEVGE